MRPIPAHIKRQMLADPFYEQCCCCGAKPVQWHHALQYGGRQINRKWAIVPACKKCHDDVDKIPMIKAYFQYVCIKRMSGQDKLEFYKKDWHKEAQWIESHWPEVKSKFNLLCLQ